MKRLPKTIELHAVGDVPPLEISWSSPTPTMYLRWLRDGSGYIDETIAAGKWSVITIPGSEGIRETLVLDGRLPSLFRCLEK